MIGALVGDVVGSRFEANNIKEKNFELFTFDCRPTDDSIMTLAVANAVLDCEDYSLLGNEVIKQMQRYGRKYFDAGYGRKFREWIISENPKPYNSWGNGAAMRISPVAYIARDLKDVRVLSQMATEVTHNHPEGTKGAESVASAIWCSLHNWSLDEIRDYICSNYYNVDFTLDQIRPDYAFHVSCQKSVPQAFEAFFESTDFEDAIRNAISIGGDSDTIACITGSIAGAYYGVPTNIENDLLEYFDPFLLSTITEFKQRYSF